MIHVVFGTEERKKVLKKHTNSVAVFIDHNEPGFSLNHYIESVSMFGQTHVYQFISFITDGGMEELTTNAVSMVASPNIFILQEEGITEPRRKKLESLGFDIGKNTSVVKKFSNEIFALSDSVYARDKKTAWVMFQTIAQKFVAEEIHGTLLWAVKMMRIYTYANALDIKPFVASNAARASKKYTPTEIDNMHRKLVHMYHDAHNGKIDFNISLESWLLSL